MELLWVKGSGGDLGTLTTKNLAVLRLDRLRSLVDVYPGIDREDEMVAAFDYCLHGKGGAAPSHRHGDARPGRRRRTSITCTRIPGSPWPPRSTGRS